MAKGGEGSSASLRISTVKRSALLSSETHGTSIPVPSLAMPHHPDLAESLVSAATSMAVTPTTPIAPLSAQLGSAYEPHLDAPGYTSPLNKRAPAYIAANIIGYVINPPGALWLASVGLLYHWGVPYAFAWPVALATLSFFVLAPMAFIALLVFTGKIESVEVRDRTARSKPFLVAMGFEAFAAALFYVWRPIGGVQMAVFFAIVAFNTLIAFVINLYWKISVHMFGVSTALAVMHFFTWVELPAYGLRSVIPQVLWWPALFVCPLLSWARVRTRAHTLMQTVAGCAVGYGVSFLIMWLIFAL